MVGARVWVVSLCLSSVGLLGCSDDESKGDDGGGGTGTNQQGLTAEEEAAANQGLAAITISAETAAYFDTLLSPPEGQPDGGGSGDLQPGGGTDENQAALEGNATGSDAGAGCVAVTAIQGGLEIDYGPPPGCTLATGSTVAGVLSLTVGGTEQPPTVTLAAGLDEMLIDGTDYDGSASFTLSDASFQFGFDLTSAGRTTAADLSLTDSELTTLVDGSASVDEAGSSVSVAFSSLDWATGDCYPRAGTAAIDTTGLGTLTATFDSSTPTTGEVSVSNGFVSVPFALPAYGSCPPSP